jgi:hypothetical protein
LAVPADAVHEYVPPGTGKVPNVNTAPTHTVAAEAVMAGVASIAATVAVAAPEVTDRQFTPPEGAVAYTVTDLVPVAAPLAVNVSLPAPLAVPGAPSHEYVALPPMPEAVNTTSVPRQTVAADTRVTVSVLGNAVIVIVATFDADAEQPAAVFTYNVYDVVAEGVTLNCVEVCQSLLSILYDAPPVADAVNVED